MWDLTKGVARQLLSPREHMDAETVAYLRKSGTLIIDERRKRPLYFDGRFLAAKDLTREQRYFLARQSDLGRATGAGVVHGLMVSVTGQGSALTIDPGHGVTDSGESVIIPAQLTVPLANATNVQRLNASFGVSRRPNEPPHTRTGLYVVALRPVEFTANPIASYPTSVADKRHVEDGDVIDAVVVSLIHYPDDGMQEDRGMRRAHLARSIFVENESRGLPVDALPLAMVLLDRGIVRWIDVHMVRREVGSAHGDVLGFGFAPRAVREAHLVQYDGHLDDVMRDRKLSNRGHRFAATDHFAALPPAGRMPAAAINTADFTQSFFPPEVDVVLSIVPEDEIPALLEESILLPPIDLTLQGDALESTSVLVLLPVPRHDVRRLRARLLQRNEALTRLLRPAAVGMIAQRKPMEVLRGLQLPRIAEPAQPRAEPTESEWAKAVSDAFKRANGTLWYVRRRNLEHRGDLIGRGVRLAANDRSEEKVLEDKLKSLGWYEEFNKIIDTQSTTVAAAELVSFLSVPKMIAGPLMLGIAFREIAEIVRLRQPQELLVEMAREAVLAGRPAPTITDVPPQPKPELALADVVEVMTRYAPTEMGDGLEVLRNRVFQEANGARLQSLLQAIAAAKVAPELDRIGDRLKGDQARIDAFVAQLIARGADGRPLPERVEAVKQFVATTLGGVP